MYKAFALVVGILRNSLTKQQQKMLLVQRFSFSLFSTYELEVILFEPLSKNNKINHLVSDHQGVPHAVSNRSESVGLVSVRQ